MDKSDFSNLAVFRKAQEIFKVSRAIACSITDSSNMLEMGYSNNYNYQYAGELVSDSLQLCPELAMVKNTSNHKLRIKRANRIRRAANSILSKCQQLEISNVHEREFLQILRKDVHQFNSLFSDWYYNLQKKQS